jgi:AcrR family transcriptional regulator
MSPSAQIAERPRRSHAERRAETRERVLHAVVESIAEVGFQKTTAAEIARRAGVTWGAVQHHFGDKEGILLAALEKSFGTFASILGTPSDKHKSLEARASLFVERSWLHFRSSHYRSTFEILLNLPPELEISWQREMLDEWKRIWLRFFPESKASRRESVDLMLYAISVFTGLAATTVLEGKRPPSRNRELGFLEDTLIRELTPPGRPR